MKSKCFFEKPTRFVLGSFFGHARSLEIFCVMKQTEYARRVDSSGRIIIPSQLREQLDIRPGDTLDFYICEDNGRTFLCVECVRVEDEVERAKRILREAGLLPKD